MIMGDSVSVQKTKVFRVKVDFDKGRSFENQCKNENTNINAKLKEMIENSLRGQKEYFLAGKNKIIYDMTNDRFSWLVELDDGTKKEILTNLSTNFLKSINEEIEKVFVERNNWLHQTKKDSVDIPQELVRGKK